MKHKKTALAAKHICSHQFVKRMEITQTRISLHTWKFIREKNMVSRTAKKKHSVSTHLTTKMQIDSQKKLYRCQECEKNIFTRQ